MGKLPLLAVLLLAACGDGGVDAALGLDEPLRIKNATFVAGVLPGLPADRVDAAEDDLPRVTDLVYQVTPILPGQAGKGFSGRVTATAVAVGLRFAELGTGYWVLPVGAPDVGYEGEMTWKATADFGLDLPAGIQVVQVVGIDAAGRAGLQANARLCVMPEIPDNLHACDPTRPLPEAVVTLAWDVVADLDLEVRMPDGTWVTPKEPLVGGPSEDPAAAVGSRIDRDGGALCGADPRRREHLVLQERPAGTLEVRTNLFDSCKQGSINYVLTVHVPQGEGDARGLREVARYAGTLTPWDETGGATGGRKIADLPF